MDVTPKFLKFLGDSDLEDDKLRVLALFWSEVSNFFPTAVQLFFRNGFAVWVGYDNTEGVFKGVGKFYREFDLKKGQSLLFEYVSMFNFKVFIIGADFAEIDYPLRPPTIKCSHTAEVVRHDGVLNFISCGQEIVDEVVVPWAFASGFGKDISHPILAEGTFHVWRSKCCILLNY